MTAKISRNWASGYKDREPESTLPERFAGTWHTNFAWRGLYDMPPSLFSLQVTIWSSFCRGLLGFQSVIPVNMQFEEANTQLSKFLIWLAWWTFEQWRFSDVTDFSPQLTQTCSNWGTEKTWGTWCWNYIDRVPFNWIILLLHSSPGTIRHHNVGLVQQSRNQVKFSGYAFNIRRGGASSLSKSTKPSRAECVVWTVRLVWCLSVSVRLTPRYLSSPLVSYPTERCQPPIIFRFLPPYPNAPDNHGGRKNANRPHDGACHGVGVLEAHEEKRYKERQ